ncbi:MAG: metabolite traffic protein EboE [Bacteroidia bacterium]
MGTKINFLCFDKFNATMLIGNNLHLTYCSNIHPGETWNEVFNALKENIPSIKKSLAPEKSFGIGLRLSDEAAKDLLHNNELEIFKSWLDKNDCYVFTMNGFPYGGFHNTIVKDDVYKPDWTTNERLLYTSNLIKILEHLIPNNSEAGISTSPLSYKPWMINSCNTTDVFETAAVNLIKCVVDLHHIRKTTGKYIHLDIEPEPDCLLENSKETIDFFNNYLIPYGTDFLTATLHVDEKTARAIITDHITVCYDVCHFAVEFGEPGEVLKAFKDAGIKIGKVQISAALKVVTDPDASTHPDPPEGGRSSISDDKYTEGLPLGQGLNRENVLKQYKAFAESTYLHQTIVRDKKNKLHHFSDLPEALKHFDDENFVEWRTHYHVPVFMQSYNELQSTQEEILKVLSILKENHFTNHLEVETYTWEVLPKEDRIEIKDSIVRELKWVIENFK